MATHKRSIASTTSNGEERQAKRRRVLDNLVADLHKAKVQAHKELDQLELNFDKQHKFIDEHEVQAKRHMDEIKKRTAVAKSIYEKACVESKENLEQCHDIMALCEQAHEFVTEQEAEQLRAKCESILEIEEAEKEMKDIQKALIQGEASAKRQVVVYVPDMDTEKKQELELKFVDTVGNAVFGNPAFLMNDIRTTAERGRVMRGTKTVIHRYPSKGKDSTRQAWIRALSDPHRHHELVRRGITDLFIYVQDRWMQFQFTTTGWMALRVYVASDFDKDLKLIQTCFPLKVGEQVNGTLVWHV